MTDVQNAWDRVWAALPAHWVVGAPSRVPGAALWSISAMDTSVIGRRNVARSVTATGNTEAEALLDLDTQLRGLNEPDATQLNDLERRLRLVYVAGAEEWSHDRTGGPLSSEELDSALGRFPGSGKPGGPQTVYSLPEIAGAIDTGARFWVALGDDDDGTLVGFLTPQVLGALSGGELEPGDPMRPIQAGASPGPDIAGRLRRMIGYESEDCRHMAISSSVEVLDDFFVRLFYVRSDAAFSYDAQTVLQGRRLDLAPNGDGWLVDPIRARDSAHMVQSYDLRDVLKWNG